MMLENLNSKGFLRCIKVKIITDLEDLYLFFKKKNLLSYCESKIR